jgi:hypothetical protein
VLDGRPRYRRLLSSPTARGRPRPRARSGKSRLFPLSSSLSSSITFPTDRRRTTTTTSTIRRSDDQENLASSRYRPRRRRSIAFLTSRHEDDHEDDNEHDLRRLRRHAPRRPADTLPPRRHASPAIHQDRVSGYGRRSEDPRTFLPKRSGLFPAHRLDSKF